METSGALLQQWQRPSDHDEQFQPEGIFKPLMDSVLGPTSFPFDWESYTPYNLLPPLPKLKEHKTVSLQHADLERFVGRYALSADIVLSVTLEGDHLFIQENDEPKQDRAESPTDFYSTSSTDECTFRLAGNGPAEALILHVDGKDLELKRLTTRAADPPRKPTRSFGNWNCHGAHDQNVSETGPRSESDEAAMLGRVAQR